MFTKIRTARDNLIVSYELEINGQIGIRHRRYLRKIVPIDVVAAVSGYGSLVDASSAERSSVEPVLEQCAGTTLMSSIVSLGYWLTLLSYHSHSHFCRTLLNLQWI